MGTTRPSWLWAGALSLGMLAGCASTRLDAQWADPQRGASPLHGARVMVACEAYDDVVARLCLDRLNDEIVARVDQLKLPSYTGFVQPKLTPVIAADGTITDVTISYPLDLTTQMLEYAAKRR